MDGDEEAAELRIVNVRGLVMALQAIKPAKPQASYCLFSTIERLADHRHCANHHCMRHSFGAHAVRRSRTCMCPCAAALLLAGVGCEHFDTVQQDCVVTLREDGVSIRMENPSKGLQSRVFLTSEVCAVTERPAVCRAADHAVVPEDQSYWTQQGLRWTPYMQTCCSCGASWWWCRCRCSCSRRVLSSRRTAG